MPSIREQLIAAGIVHERCDAVKAILARMRSDAMVYIGRFDSRLVKLARRDRFAQGVKRDASEAARNPATSGGLQGPARLRQAIGSDSKGKFRLSGPATKHGMTYVATTRQSKVSDPSKNQCPHRDAKGNCVSGAACRKES